MASARKNSPARYREGDRIQATTYGKTEQGTVTRVSRSGGIVFAVMDGTTRERWFHAATVTRAGARSNPAREGDLSPWDLTVKRVKEQGRRKRRVPATTQALAKIGDMPGGEYPSYAWPGGYQLFYTLDDRSRKGRNIAHVHPDVVNSGKGVGADDVIVGVDVNWEDADMVCDISGVRIPPAYGDDE